MTFERPEDLNLNSETSVGDTSGSEISPENRIRSPRSENGDSLKKGEYLRERKKGVHLVALPYTVNKGEGGMETDHIIVDIGTWDEKMKNQVDTGTIMLTESDLPRPYVSSASPSREKPDIIDMGANREIGEKLQNGQEKSIKFAVDWETIESANVNPDIVAQAKSVEDLVEGLSGYGQVLNEAGKFVDAQDIADKINELKNNPEVIKDRKKAREMVEEAIPLQYGIREKVFKFLGVPSGN